MGVINYIKHPSRILLKLDNFNIIKLSDEAYIKILYKSVFDKEPDLNNPKTFNEKLQWLKLYDRKDIYTTMVDKYEVKGYVSSIIGDEYIVPTLGMYDSFSDIDFDKLPNKFVIKCTHDSGGLVICKNKEEFDIDSARRIIEKSLKNNFYYQGREWPYKNVRPRIIVEKYMIDEKDDELRDYKFFCFNGKVKIMFIASNRQGNGDTYFDFYDKDFNHLDIINGHPNAPIPPHKPENYSLMIKLAEKLSKKLPQVRIDFYETNNRVYFGEMTLFHWSGFVPFEPEEWDYKLGEWLNIPKRDDNNE